MYFYFSFQILTVLVNFHFHCIEMKEYHTVCLGGLFRLKILQGASWCSLVVVVSSHSADVVGPVFSFHYVDFEDCTQVIGLCGQAPLPAQCLSCSPQVSENKLFSISIWTSVHSIQIGLFVFHWWLFASHCVDLLLLLML